MDGNCGFVAWASPTCFTRSESWDVLVFVSRSASASGGWRGVCRLHAELEGERLPDPAGATVSGHEQPIHQGKTSVVKPITVVQLDIWTFSDDGRAEKVLCGFLLLNPPCLFPSDSSVSSWLRHAKSSQVLRSVGARPRSCGKWWCRSAACPSNTRGTATAEWA